MGTGSSLIGLPALEVNQIGLVNFSSFLVLLLCFIVAKELLWGHCLCDQTLGTAEEAPVVYCSEPKNSCLLRSRFGDFLLLPCPVWSLPDESKWVTLSCLLYSLKVTHKGVDLDVCSTRSLKKK